jgi:itaconate CoA-transferase
MYKAEYQRKLTTPEKAVEYLKHSQTLIHGVANGEPPALLAAIAQRLRDGDLADITVYTALPLEHVAKTILSPDLADKITVNCWFVSSAERDLVNRGINHFVPNELHQIPRLIRDFIKTDVVVTTVSPMDKAGFFSFGVSNAYISAAARACGRLLVEVNPHMPRVFGDALLHISEVDAVVEHEAPILEGISETPKPEADAIGRLIAEMVPDEATLQWVSALFPTRSAGIWKTTGTWAFTPSYSFPA